MYPNYVIFLNVILMIQIQITACKFSIKRLNCELKILFEAIMYSNFIPVVEIRNK